MNWLLRLRRRRRLHQDLSEEIAFHRAMRAQDPQPPPFGNETRLRESLYELWSFHAVETTLRDVVYACRGFRRSPGLTVTLVTSLALGIGAVMAVFTAADNLLFRRLPYPNPDQLVMIWETNHARPGAAHHLVSPDNFLDWQARSHALQTMAVVDDARTVVRDGDRAQELHLQSVTGNFFSLLGIRPFLGKAPTTPADERAAGDVVFISDRLWRSWFDGAPGAVGRQVLLDTRPFTIGGVMPAGFSFGDRDVDLWTVFSLSSSSGGRGGRSLRAIGRLAPGMTIGAAQTEMTRIAQSLEDADRTFNQGWTITLEPLRDAFTHDVKGSLLMLLGAVGLLLTLACANAANLLLARNASRGAELALQSALGAGTWRIARRLIVESLLVALVAGAAGIGVGWFVLGRLVALSPRALTQTVALAVDWRIVGFAVGIALLTGLVFGVGPALVAARSVVGRAPGSARGRGARAAGRSRGWLIASEIAMAVILLVGSAVLARSLLRLQRVDPGLDPAHLLTFHFRVGSPRDVHLFADSIERIERLPGVQSASATSFLPFSGPAATTGVRVVGSPTREPGEELKTIVRTVMPRYFETIGTPVRRGREFSPSDNTRDAPIRFVVNETFVRRYLAGVADPLSARIVTSMARTNPSGEIIGVVGDVKEGSLSESAVPTVYYPYARLPYGQMTLLVRTVGDPMTVVRPTRQIVHDLEPGVALADIETMEAIVGDTYASQRFSALLMGSFASFALLLAAVGVYGVVTFSVSTRTKEIGIRMALGARPHRIATLAMGDTARFVIAGLIVGLIIAFWLVTLISGLLFEMSARDPLAFAAASLLLLTGALAAAYAPIRQATRVNPVSALRGD